MPTAGVSVRIQGPTSSWIVSVLPRLHQGWVGHWGSGFATCVLCYRWQPRGVSIDVLKRRDSVVGEEAFLEIADVDWSEIGPCVLIYLRIYLFVYM